MAKWPYSTATWRKLRLAKLGSDPLCQPCKARKQYTAANTIDHIKPFARQFKGFDEQGDPVDPSDGWHGGGASNHENASAQGAMWETGKDLVSEVYGDIKPDPDYKDFVI